MLHHTTVNTRKTACGDAQPCKITVPRPVPKQDAAHRQSPTFCSTATKTRSYWQKSLLSRVWGERTALDTPLGHWKATGIAKVGPEAPLQIGPSPILPRRLPAARRPYRTGKVARHPPLAIVHRHGRQRPLPPPQASQRNTPPKDQPFLWPLCPLVSRLPRRPHPARKTPLGGANRSPPAAGNGRRRGRRCERETNGICPEIQDFEPGGPVIRRPSRTRAPGELFP